VSDYYIGIDPGTSCGWAVLDEDGKRLASGIWDLKSRRHEGGGMRYVRAQRYVDELLRSFVGAQLGYEEIRRHAGTSAAHVYGGIIAQLTAVCETSGVPYRGIPVATIKRCATGRGNSSKGDMERAAYRRWEHDCDHDEADALWIAECMRHGL
tara:strand:+ start:679 stop:1137 length:459 start_codon:yes stop_codon:yes gene_type:complete